MKSCLMNILFITQVCVFEIVLQISRSIGDVYLKKVEFNREPLYAKFRLCDPIRKSDIERRPISLDA
ncbi:hypothetical protein HanPI659440_Chr09g0337311 [Helianthus annuus]|nr:hypothetical protein HanPI659440_Chr09g0337311 [Helianthus annuus]